MDYKEIVDNYGEAFYLLDSKKFRNNFVELKNAFSDIYSEFNIAYSYKTNYIPKLCKIVNELGGYAEVVSEMELELALKIGVSYDKIIWNGPIKNKQIVESFLLKGGIINIDNYYELNDIKEIVNNNKDIIFNLGVRCNFDVCDDVVSRFGFDVSSDDFNNTIDYLKNTKNMRFVSLQCHFAKRQIEYWKNKVEGIIKVIDKIGYIPDIVDVGGGLFGKMNESLEKQFDCKIPTYKEYAEIIATSFKERFLNEDKKPLLLIEPGSALVGDCMKFVSVVKSIKNIRGKNYATVLGSQKNISMSGVNPPIEVIRLGNDTKTYDNLDFVGFTCIESDVLYHNYSGDLSVNDLLVIGNCGSYSIVMKPPFILPNFPILEINNNEIEIVKNKETFDDVFKTYNL